MCWNPITNNRIRKRIQDTMVMTLEICPHKSDNIAIGYKSGTVLLLQINEHEINELCRFSGHDSDIQSISWCHKYIYSDNKPSLELKTNVSDDEETLENNQNIVDYLPNVFATTSRDKYVRFWNCLSGECLLEIQIEAKKDIKHNAKQRNWYSVLWLTQFKIFITDSNGKIWSINLKEFDINNMKTICLSKKNEKRLSKDVLRTFEEGHSRCIFSIIGIKNRSHCILSVSLDRNIICWDVNTLKSLWIMRCLGGYVYDLDIAPWNTSLLAVAVGDKMIRVWTVPDKQQQKENKNNDADEEIEDRYILNPLYNLNLHTLQKDRKSKYRHKKRQEMTKNDPYCVKTIWRGLKDKITAIKWHPRDKGWLGYGTDKGCVGCLDINSDSKHKHVHLLTYQQSNIIQVDWKIIALKYRNDYKIGGVDSSDSTWNNKRNKKHKGNKKNIESGFRIYSLSRDGNIYEGDGWNPWKQSININQYILAANQNIKNILQTPSEKDIKWTCFCMEVMNVYHVDKYKSVINKMKVKDNKCDINEDEYTGQRVVIGTDNGNVFIFNGDWKLLCVFNDYNSLISCIQINPFHNVCKDIFCNNLVAAGTVDGYILFYNYKDYNKTNMICKVKHSPKNKAVTKLKWHPFDANIIVSISIDKRYPLHIWDVTNISNGKIKKVLNIQSDISKYAHLSWFTNYHHSRYLSVEWSHNDPFILYTAAEDQTCRRLDLKQILSSTNMDIYHQNIKYNQLKAVTFNCSKQSQPNIVKIEHKPQHPQQQHQQGQNLNKKQITQKHHKLFRSFESQKIETSINSLWKLIKYYASFISNNKENDGKLESEFDANDLLLLCTNDISKHKISNWISSILQNQHSGLYPVELLPSMSYQMGHLIQNNSKSIIEKELNKFSEKFKTGKHSPTIPELPSFLSLLMSPTLGREKWLNSMLNLCEYYKHPKIGLYHNAASIYLSLSAPEYIYLCIDMYCNIHYYVEALTIAKYHLLPNHPKIKQILYLYADKCLSKKNYIMAIKCYLSTLSLHINHNIYFKKHFIEIMRKYVFEILLKHYFINSFQSEYNAFLSLKSTKTENLKINKRRIGKNDINSLVLLYDIIHLLSDIFANKENNNDSNDEYDEKNENENENENEITDIINKKYIDDIFAIYMVLTLCVYSQSPNIKQIIDSNKMLSIQTWPFVNNCQLFVWKSLFFLASILDVDKYNMINITQISENIHIDKNHIFEICSLLQRKTFSIRIDYMINCYSLPNDVHQIKRIHCVKFANYLFESYCYSYSKADALEFESVIWECLKYASTYNTLFLLHEYLGSLLSFWKNNIKSDLFIIVHSIFNTLELFQDVNINVVNLLKDYINVINKFYQANQSQSIDLFKCKLIIKFLVLLLSSIKISETIHNLLDKNVNLWMFVQSVTNDKNLNTIESLIAKCKNMFVSQKVFNDPYLAQYKTQIIVRQCLNSIIKNVFLP